MDGYFNQLDYLRVLGARKHFGEVFSSKTPYSTPYPTVDSPLV